ncbi:hypothetical protein NEUTE1DRAFT_117234 [Neurospora tetrasperma FGSC 2508]|uniref:Uncharacterized protein n=1 Tax=Neurospora tetrasperma (strain FGSC 2508 / ATCC MYA-4615 / P0657) TaxID=510951 RepID=F8MNR6_NEUT8|nr:uncharacterized protein NEUTE1DRAFT_117234 [Neurospora tetrasperma FGSC 2508]EGO56188.1 hypothetical protein NEUTE1DRAFT_117234 [Neurospora tetrasperma FGSC 2508]EGZ70957.1 hypothetical protein NEUTE2DRAFT_145240 [Neurospora tetrasperma FGSC 2509]
MESRLCLRFIHPSALARVDVEARGKRVGEVEAHWKVNFLIGDTKLGWWGEETGRIGVLVSRGREKSGYGETQD